MSFNLSDSVLKYRSLDHWRGVAALGVLVFHGFHGMTVHPIIQWLAWLGSFGWFGVHLFFVISGYCIAANVCRLAQKDAGTWQFLRDRLLRIYPTYWGACLFALVLALVSIPFNHTSLAHNLPAGPVAAVSNILLVEPYTGVSPFLLVSWSLVYELGFYALVAIGFGLAHVGIRPPWLLLAAIALGFVGLFGPWNGALYILNYWPEFFSGGIVFLALWLKSRAILTGQLLLLVPVMFTAAGIFTLPHGQHVEQMIGASVFAVALYYLHPLDEKISRWHPLTWLGWVGTLSYSLYLVHVPLGRVLGLGTRFIPYDSVWFVFLIILYWAVAITGAWVFYCLCESPLERWRHHLRKKPSVKVPLAGLAGKVDGQPNERDSLTTLNNILLIIGSHLCTAPRPQKEALALMKAGHEVSIIGVWSNPELVERDRRLIKQFGFKFIPLADFSATSVNSRWAHFATRLRGRISKSLYRTIGWYSPELSGHCVRKMLFAAQKHGADLTIIHAESGLWVGCQLLARGLRVGVDFEDWYSEDIPTLEKINHPFKQLKHFESQLLRKCSYRLATSKVMADGLAAAYGTPRPVCIYNTFPRLERQHMDGRILDRQRGDIPSIVWFSQTIGTGRGLEPFLAALPMMKYKFEIHLRGSIRPEVKSRFLALCPDDWRDCLYFHPTVPNHELLSRLAEHDIGLALEPSDIQNKNLTVSNKLFQYLQAGLAIVATRTAGQAEVLSNVPEVGELTDYEPEKMAAAVNRLLESDNHLSKAKQASLTGFENLYCWERQEPVLVEHAQAALNSK